MRYSAAFRVILGIVACGFLVIQPLRANLVASAVYVPGLPVQAQALILEEATRIDKCNMRLLEMLGDAHMSINNYVPAAIGYGRAMACSPASSIMRVKYGEAMLALGFIEGTQFVEQGIKLEPNNPLFLSERERLKARLQRWP